METKREKTTNISSILNQNDYFLGYLFLPNQLVFSVVENIQIK